MRIFSLEKLSQKELSGLFSRPAINFEKSFKAVRPILIDVKNEGQKAALEYARKYDMFTDESIFVSKKDFQDAEINLSADVKNALKKAAANIEKFHSKQSPVKYEVETVKGVFCSREYRPIDNVGLYIPGGSAVLPSTMLMLGIPSKIAGCKRVVASTPVKNNPINHAVLFAAKLCGVHEFMKIGGAQGIALLAYGDREFKKVDKIFGPGNQYVTAAKALVSIDPVGCAIDMPAGPSEVLIIADESADASFIAADLLSQAEHGPDSQVILITNSIAIAAEVKKQIAKQLKLLPRKAIAEQSLKSSFILEVKSIDEAIDLSNNYAPEHLIINASNATRLKSKIHNAGSVFLGTYSCESAGDYASGTNHSLPTYGYARSFGGVTVESFMKTISFQSLTKNGLKNISGTIIELAGVENLDAHANAVKIRL
ncbi:MAG: histidinol dehydrogenase [bacterium]